MPKISLRTSLALVLIAGLIGLNVYQFRKPPPQVSDATALLWLYDKYDGDLTTVWQNRWFGIETLQNPNDVWITQEIMWEVHPDFVIEAGTYKGGSAALWATMLEQINPEGRVITIDIEDLAADAKKLPIVQRKVDFIVASSTDSATVADIAKRVKGKKVMMILDSAHTKEHVLKEIQLYSPLISVGSYLIVQDSNNNGHPNTPNYGPGPWEAIHAFMPTTKDFIIDKSRERLLLTVSPDGFLKRIH